MLNKKFSQKRPQGSIKIKSKTELNSMDVKYNVYVIEGGVKGKQAEVNI